MNVRIIILFFCVIFIDNQLSGQKLTIETKIDTNRIVIGDQIRLSYILTKDKSTNIKLPVFSQKLTEGIEIIGIPVIDSTGLKNTDEQIELKMLITAFDTGVYYIPPQAFILSHAGLTDTIHSKATYLEVMGVAIDTTGTIRDIKATEKVPFTFREILPYLVIFLIAAIIVTVVIIYIKRHKKKSHDFIPLKPAEPAYITALRELDKIKSQKLWQQKEVKEYYSRITHVIRWYISRRFAIKALEHTSYEVLKQMKSLKLDQINYTNLESLLNLADMVKFAKGEPNPDDNIVHLDNAYDFIKLTKEESLQEDNIKENEV